MLAISCIATTSYAHCLWLETSADGKLNAPQEVKVFYGEYGENIHETTAGKFTDMKDFTLWLLTPDNKKVQLHCTAATDCYVANFTPTVPGIYTLLLENTALAPVETKGAYATIKPFFYARTSVTVKGNQLAISDSASPLQPVWIDWDLRKKYKEGDACSLTVWVNNKPLADHEVTVYAPTGWGKILTTDANGQAVFPALWKGRYVIEVIHLDKAPGEDNGKAYQSIRQVATFAVNVGK